MHTFDSIVFDLDGTLWDTSAACAVAWNGVLADLGIPYRKIEPHDVQVVTGMPHDECIQSTFSDLSDNDQNLISDETMTADNEVIAKIGGGIYSGVTEGLRELAKTHKLFIVSNCQTGYIEMFLRQSGLGEVLTDFECWGNTGRPKADNLKAVIDRNNLKAPIMIGDTEGDESAARACRIPFGFVDYGFGRAKSPDFVWSSFPALVATFRLKS